MKLLNVTVMMLKIAWINLKYGIKSYPWFIILEKLPNCSRLFFDVFINIKNNISWDYLREFGTTRNSYFYRMIRFQLKYIWKYNIKWYIFNENKVCYHIVSAIVIGRCWRYSLLLVRFTFIWIKKLWLQSFENYYKNWIADVPFMSHIFSQGLLRKKTKCSWLFFKYIIYIWYGVSRMKYLHFTLYSCLT